VSKTNERPYRVERHPSHPKHVLSISMDVRAGWEQWFLLSSDRHHDNSHADHKLELRHLNRAKERRAGVLDFGDLFCAMQGKYDKRASKDALPPELREGNYLDRIVAYNADFYRPFRDHLILVQAGNHETAIQKHHETDLTERFVERLNAPDKSRGEGEGDIIAGGFSGWVRFRFTTNQTKRSTLLLYRHHGYGGGGAVTKGVIQTNRMAVYLPDATFVVTGHTHDQWLLPLQRHRITHQGDVFQDTQWHIRCGGYKDEHTPGDGYHIEKGREPKPLGAVWLRFFADTGDTGEGKISFEITPAS
jgi:hypothetical protein